MDFDTFKTNFDRGHNQMVTLNIPEDLNTPVTAYLKLTKDEKYSFLLESVEGGKTLSRYSIIGCNPDLILTNKTPDEIKSALAACKIGNAPDNLPPMAVSGLFGYLSYDMIRHFETIPDDNIDELNVPESILIRPTLLCIFDHVKKSITLVSPCYQGVHADAEIAWKHHQDIVEAAKWALYDAVPKDLLHYETNLNEQLTPQSNIGKAEYINAVQKAKDYIHEGDIFQVVLSQRFSCDFDLPPFALYRCLRMLNPSPFMFHMQMNGFSIVGASPEILVGVHDRTMVVRPIAGTRPRGETPEDDEDLAKDLLADKKENAEHLMLLDLGRNDVGRVCAFGSVNVTEQFTIERYSHVMHIVSNVEGKLRDDIHGLNALFSGFPAGTVSGAPKIRAMEIIDELETTKRGIYAGGIGFLSSNGDIEICIALRTGIIKDGQLHVQAGAGIVADSNPESEHQECINKSQALFAAASKAIALTHQDHQ